MPPGAIAVPIPAASVTPEATPAVKSPAPEFRPAGDRITTLEMNSATFFDSGSATLSKAGETVLQEVTVELKLDMFRDYQITVEGHTDDTPIHTSQFPSNWELSTARAAAVVHFFLEQGIPARKLRAAGYADTFPKAPNRDANGNAIPENQSQNRRVVIRLEKIDKAERPAATSPDAGFVPPSDLQ
jgi:chemotaxis protein MotB